MPDPATEFFVSYTGADQAWAEWIADQLEAAGHPVVLQAWDFRPGENFVLRMNQALEQAEQVRQTGRGQAAHCASFDLRAE